MAFDGLIVRAEISSLNTKLIGGKINKILQPNKNEIILNIYSKGKNYSLLISTNPELCRFHLTNFSKPNPKTAFNFCMLLRKYLTGSKIVSISNFDLERTIKITLDCYNELNDLIQRNLYIQIMNRQSNIILTNENNIIIDCLKHSEKCLPANIFESAISNKIIFFSLKNFEEFKSILDKSENKNLINFICNNFIGFSKNSISYYLEVLKIHTDNYSTDELKTLYNYLKSIINDLIDRNNSFNIINNDYFVLPHNSSNLINLDELLDNFYHEKEENLIFSSSKNNLLKIVLANSKKISKKLENINNKLAECKDMEKYRLYGELLTSNLYRINSNENLAKIEIENYYDNNNLITIPLDNKISVQKNIEKYFKKYNKLKNTLEIVSKQKQIAELEINYIESIVFSIDNVKTASDLDEISLEISQNLDDKKHSTQTNKINKRSSSLPTLEHLIIDGYEIYYGKNNIQNNYLTLKFANRSDIWFHAQKIQGSHVVLKVHSTDEILPENIIFTCAKLAKDNSKAKDSLNVPIDYCKIKFVKKIPGAKPGMVNYTNYKTIIVK